MPRDRSKLPHGGPLLGGPHPQHGLGAEHFETCAGLFVDIPEMSVLHIYVPVCIIHEMYTTVVWQCLAC